jgi:hypothetical protein
MARTISTTTPLAGSAQWPASNVLGNYTLESQSADRLTGYVFTDQAGNIFIEQSFDQTNWDISTTYAIVANTTKTFSEEILAPWVRVRYVNGATPQTVLRLYVRMESAGPRP